MTKEDFKNITMKEKNSKYSKSNAFLTLKNHLFLDLFYVAAALS